MYSNKTTKMLKAANIGIVISNFKITNLALCIRIARYINLYVMNVIIFILVRYYVVEEPDTRKY